MAGHGPSVVRHDPALMKWYKMNNERHKYFRWTKQTAFITFMYVVAVPSVLGVMGYMTEGKWELRGKRRGDLISEY